MRFWVFSVLVTLLAVSLFGQIESSSHERVLVPSFIRGELPGARGSIWVTRLVGYNANGFRVEVVDSPNPCRMECPVPPANAFTAFTYDSPTPAVPAGGVFIYIKMPGNENVDLHLRVQDISRQSQTWGTEVPIIRERDVFTGNVRLLDIPTSAEFRATLRLFDFDGFGGRVHVRIVRTGNAEPAAEADLELTHPFNVPEEPGQAAIMFLTEAFPQLAGEGTVRIELTPVDPTLRYWAYASITNNETQHVTLVTPQK